jgi:replicative DNA helicase
LDLRLNGGLGGGELGVIIAPTGFGKSYSLINMACGAVRNKKNALFYSLELSAYNLGVRADAHFSGIEVDEIHKNKELVKQRLEEQRNSMGGFILRKFPVKSKTVSGLKTYTEKLNALGFRPDIIFVDYADIIKPSSTDSEKRMQLGAIYEDLRA